MIKKILNNSFLINIHWRINTNNYREAISGTRSVKNSILFTGKEGVTGAIPHRMKKPNLITHIPQVNR